MIDKLRLLLMSLKLVNGEKLIPTDKYYGKIIIEFRAGKIYKISPVQDYIPEMIAQ